jgi:hypothetical protein
MERRVSRPIFEVARVLLFIPFVSAHIALIVSLVAISGGSLPNSSIFGILATLFILVLAWWVSPKK